MPALRFGAKKKSEYLELLREGCRRGKGARGIGVSYECVRIHMRSDPEFAAAVEQAEEEAHEIVEDALFQSAKGGNVTAQIFWLCNRCPDRWQSLQKQQIEHTGEAVAKLDKLIERIDTECDGNTVGEAAASVA